MPTLLTDRRHRASSVRVPHDSAGLRMAIGTEGCSIFLSKWPKQRRELLARRGLMIARIVVPPPWPQETLHWHVPLPNADLDGARWIVDGSLLDGPRRATRRPGFALLLLSPRDTPLAVASGTPPDWIHTANGAEAWGLLQVLYLSVGRD